MKSREHVTTNGKAAFYASIWDDLRQAAMDCGWALGLHGSLAKDMDIMAMPWTDGARPVEDMIKALSGCFTGSPYAEHHLVPHHNKPNGRVVYTMSIWADFHLDINVIERTEAQSAPKPKAEGSPSSLPPPSPGETALDLEARLMPWLEKLAKRAALCGWNRGWKGEALDPQALAVDLLHEPDLAEGIMTALAATPGAQESRPLTPSSVEAAQRVLKKCFHILTDQGRHHEANDCNQAWMFLQSQFPEPQTLSEEGRPRG